MAISQLTRLRCHDSFYHSCLASETTIAFRVGRGCAGALKMPIPLRTNPNTTQGNNRRDQLTKPKQRVQPHELHKTTIENFSKEEDGSSVQADAVSSADSAKGSGNTSLTTSRIPSPTKRETLSQSSHSHRSDTSRQKAPPKGHARQRSTAIPPSNTSQILGHTRSISTVSVNTTSTSSSDPPKAAIKPPLVHKSRNVPSPTKLRPVSQHQKSVAPGSDTSLRSNNAPVHDERLRNELFQLSIVHEKSSRSMPIYRRSIEDVISLKNAELLAVHCSTQDRKRDLSTSLNLQAINSWLQTSGYQKTCQSLQNLSVTLRDLSNLECIFEGDDGLATVFDSWQAMINMESDDSTEGVTNDYVCLHLIFETQIFPELQIIKQRLAAASATLSSLPYTPPDSSLARVIQSQLALARTIELQCQVMLAVGERLVLQHQQWRRREITNALSEISDPKKAAKRESQPTWSP